MPTLLPQQPPQSNPSSGSPPSPSRVIPGRQENEHEEASPPFMQPTFTEHLLCAGFVLHPGDPDTAETAVRPQGAYCLVRGDRHMNKISAGALGVFIGGRVGQRHKWSVRHPERGKTSWRRSPLSQQRSSMLEEQTQVVSG